MTRSEALAYLQARFNRLATEAGMGTADDSSGYGPVLDGALRLLGFSTAQLATANVASADEAKYLSALQYEALRHVQRQVVMRVDISLDGPQVSKSRSQFVRNLAAMLAEARTECASYGLIDTQPAITIGRMTLDFLEPEATG